MSLPWAITVAPSGYPTHLSQDQDAAARIAGATPDARRFTGGAMTWSLIHSAAAADVVGAALTEGNAP